MTKIKVKETAKGSENEASIRKTIYFDKDTWQSIRTYRFQNPDLEKGRDLNISEIVNLIIRDHFKNLKTVKTE